MSDFIKVEWDKAAAGIVQQRLEGLRGAQQRAALRYALSDTTRWAGTQTVRRLSAAKRIQQKIIRRRVIPIMPTATKLSGYIWVGVGGIRAIDLGPSRQDASGVSARGEGGNFRFPHAFLAAMPSRVEGGGQHTGVFRFPSSKKPPSRWTKGRPKTSPPNLPIEEVRVQLQPEAGRILAALASEAGSRVIDLAARKIQQFIESGKAPSE